MMMQQKTADATPLKEKKYEDTDILYKLDDVPPWYLSLLLGLQHYITMFSGAIAVPLIISTDLCMANDSPYRGHMISTSLFASGLATFLQATFGCRLPIIQGPSLVFLVPILATLSLPQWKCPSMDAIRNMTEEEAGEVWMLRMREVQGAIIVAAVTEVLVGVTGLIGFMMKFITPLSIAPTITLIGLALFKEAANEASGNWLISGLTMFLLTVFSLYLANVKVPICSYSKHKRWRVKKIYFFKLFPVILTILIVWCLCAILTVTDTFSESNPARTDLRISALAKSPWIRVPYPGQWGMPTFSIGPALGVVAGVMASAIESVGDYYACAKLVGGPAPPIHAVNRGIMVEGLGCVIAGFYGTGTGLTSFSQNIGAIAITKVGSRRIIQFAAVIMTLFGMIGKFGALFIAVPTPVMGGIFCVMFAVITGVGLSSLQYINLNSSRNLFILGISIFMGLCIPNYLESHPETINTGNILANQVLEILLKTSMLVGGLLGCFLDNTVPASEERGKTKWSEEITTDDEVQETEIQCYNMPFGMNVIRQSTFLKYFPICPTYKNQNSKIIFDFFSKMCKKNNIKPHEVTEITLQVTAIP